MTDPRGAVREIVERSCREQGIALAVTDPAAIGRLADLLTTKRTADLRKSTAQEERHDGDARSTAA